MKASFAQLLTATATLAGGIASASAALASDTLLAKAAAPTLALTQAAVPRLRAQPELVLASDSYRWVADVRSSFSEARPGAECTKPCAGARKGPLIADQLLNQLGADPLLGLVMAPVTRGVPISTGDGAPALALAVIPDQITRGRGLVAIGHF